MAKPKQDGNFYDITFLGKSLDCVTDGCNDEHGEPNRAIWMESGTLRDYCDRCKRGKEKQ